MRFVDEFYRLPGADEELRRRVSLHGADDSEAERMEAEGCYYLYHVHGGAYHPEYTAYYELIATEGFAWSQLPTILRAAESLAWWAAESPPLAKGCASKGDSGKDVVRETVDPAGFVTNPADPTAYIPAKDILRSHTPAALATSHKQLLRLLEKNPDIKRWRPQRNRLSIHLADWLNYVQNQTSHLDGDDFLADELEIEARTAAIRRKKAAGE